MLLATVPVLLRIATMFSLFHAELLTKYALTTTQLEDKPTRQ